MQNVCMGVRPRDRLMQVADELFYTRGLRAVGIDEIIAKAGVAKATLYAHFPTKDDLIAAYLQQRRDDWCGHLEAKLARYAEDPLGRIDAIFRVVMEGCGVIGFQGCPFINAAAEYRDREHPALKVVVAQRRWISELFQGAAKQAHLHQPAVVADQLTLLYDSALVGSQLAGDSVRAARAREAARTLVTAASQVRHRRHRRARR